MSTIVTRAGKGSALSFVEMDANFTNLNTDKLEITALAPYETSAHAAATYATQVALATKQNALPTQTGNNGKYLGTDGTTLSWNTVDALPPQTGNNDKYLTTNGSVANWTTFSGVSLTGIETLTNKTITTPVINTNINFSGTSGAIQVNGVDKIIIGSTGQVGVNGINFGTAGQVLTSGGPSAAATWGSSTATKGIQVFTTIGANTFTVPAGVTAVKVTTVGGGGNGGSQSTVTGSAGAGGGGGTAINVVTGLTPGSTVSVTVGAAGGTTSFGAYCSATGGAAGTSNQSSTALTVTSGGTGTGGNLNITGGFGGSLGNGSNSGGAPGSNFTVNTDGTALVSTPGVGLFGGVGGQGPSSFGASGGAASGYGCGGGGAWRLSSGSFTGGAGSQGIVIVEW